VQPVTHDRVCTRDDAPLPASREETAIPAITVPGGASAPELNAHLAVPPVGDGPWPGVVVLHESFGLIDDIRQQADRLAAAGYLAVAPDLYTAGGYVRCVQAAFRSLTRGEGKAFEDIDAVRRWLAERPDCSGRVGVIGFCMGGGFALLTAGRGFDAASANYAHLPKDLDGALRGACPVVASYGGKDRTLRGTAAKLEAALDRAGVPHDVKEYPGASHSFLNQYTGLTDRITRVVGIGHHAPSADDAWRRIDAFFDRHLAA
jgi:carboxymethylenebutenolidase